MYKIIREDIKQSSRTIRAVAGNFRGHLLNYDQPSRYPKVMMYHSVSDRADRDWGPWKYAITPQRFESQLSYFDENRTVISLRRLVNWMTDDGSIPPDSIVLTFDDAYRDFRSEALPLLEQHGFQATVYVPTALLESGSVPFEHKLGEALSNMREVDITVGDLDIEASLRTRTEVIETYQQIRSELKSESIERQERVLNSLDTVAKPKDTVLGPEELRELEHNRLVTIGGHSHNHIPLRALSSREQRMNIERCRNVLTEILGAQPQHFSFPYGSVDQSAVRAVKEAGFKSAVTTRPRPVSARDWRQPYKIPRIDAATESVGSESE